MFDDDQQTPNTLNVAYEFNEGGKHKMMVFEVRHWDSNHEAGIGGADGGKNLNTVGNTFYGSKGYLAIDNYNKYDSWLGNVRAGQDDSLARERSVKNRGRQQLA